MITWNNVTIGKESLPDPEGLTFQVSKHRGSERAIINANVRFAIDKAAVRWKFRPLPRKPRVEHLVQYIYALNGFERPKKRPLTIKGAVVASDYTRVVLGDYGAYVEIPVEHLSIAKEIKLKEKQEWRADKEYLAKRELTKRVKYIWYTWKLGEGYPEIKVYMQLNTVKYADYLPGFYYISVLDFDEYEEEVNVA